MNRFNVILIILLTLVMFLSTQAQDSKPAQKPVYLSQLDIDMQWFLSYLNGENKGVTVNEFTLKRGYVNIKKKINNTFSGRITTDLTVDKEGDGEGDVEIRLKYLYLKTQLPTYGIFHKPYFEVGLVHTPWLDFEQHINRYRVQGAMFLDRNSVVSSGDYGIVFLSNIGNEMDKAYLKKVNKSNAGTYGSLAIGVFNGGGYHALEKNENKSIEGRLTIRPMHKVIPGLQFTYHGAIGKGNIAESPDWQYHSGYLSFESTSLVFTGEYYKGDGNYKGSAIQDTVSYKALPQNGYSVFGEWKILKSKVSLFGRYDHFTQEFHSGDMTSNRTIGGIAFHFIRGSKIILDYDYLDYTDKSKKDSHMFEVAIEFKY